MNYIINVEGAIYNDDQWLIIKRSEQEEYAPGILSHVGGKVESTIAESDVLEKSLRREILEEVGIEVKDVMHYLDSSTFFAGDECVVDIVFLCEYSSGTATCKSIQEVSEVKWVNSEDILRDESATPWLKRSLQLAVDKRQQLLNG